MTETIIPDLNDEWVAAAATQTHEIWSGGYSLPAHVERQKDILRRAGPDILRYIGLSDETGLIASMKRYGLVVHVPGAGPTPAIGIGAVYTRKDARKKGAAAKLLNWLLEDARAQGNALALLYSEIGTSYYEKFGFVALPSNEHSAATNDLPNTTSLSIRPATHNDHAAILALHEASWEPKIVRIARKIEHLRFFLFRNSADSVFMLQRQGIDVGYVIAALHDGKRDDGVVANERTLWVDEWAAPGIAIADILGAIRIIARAQSVDRIAAWLSPWHEHSPFIAKVRHEPIAMACALNAPLHRIDSQQTFFGSLDHF